VLAPRRGLAARAGRKAAVSIGQPLRGWVEERFNLLLVRGVHDAESRVAHGPILRDLDWSRSLDLVRYGTAELMGRELRENEVAGSVAELGVGTGSFAVVLNHQFPDRELHLFDTFTGFDPRDIEANERMGLSGSPYEPPKPAPERVVARLPHPERAHVHVGWFPQTAQDLDDERFCLVSIDVGLFQPTLAGLRWFYPRLEAGGLIMVADYAVGHAPGVKRAVRAFAREHHVGVVPIPDWGATALIAKPNRA
jgi:O-methyltransferase